MGEEKADNRVLCKNTERPPGMYRSKPVNRTAALSSSEAAPTGRECSLCTPPRVVPAIRDTSSRSGA